jgi:hypothetical protein
VTLQGVLESYTAYVGLDFVTNRYWIRGWTLQETVAPKTILFDDANWCRAGTKAKLVLQISKITWIPTDVLLRGGASKFSVAQKMSWAAGRQTNRLEDQACCLMGILDVDVPLLLQRR